MNWFKNIYSILFVLLLLEIHPVSQGNNHNIFLPISDNKDGHEISSGLTNNDISDEKKKRLFFFTYSLSNYKKYFFLITLYLPITFYFIKLLIISRRTPRLPPAI